MLIRIGREMLNDTLAGIGAHEKSLPVFRNKSVIEPLKLFKVRTPAANIIKQEMLAAGGDAVTPAGSVACTDNYIDILLLGSRKHYSALLKKLDQMPFFGMDKIKEELEDILTPKIPVTALRDGRKLTYEKMRIMGILNITPDSFYTGSRIETANDAVCTAGQMLADGADILDIGGESTRPGSMGIDAAEEEKRVLPVLCAIRKAYPEAVLSIDTFRASTAKTALDAGADIINDVSAMEADNAMVDLVVESGAPVILMHMRGTPETMQQNCCYKNVVEEVVRCLVERAQLLHGRGVGKDAIILDPGIGFAKTGEQNLLLMRDLSVFAGLGYPVMLAASRKSVIGKVLGDMPAEERLEGTIAASCQAVFAGVNIVRVHDVKENVRAIRMLEAILCPRHI
ncbi:MAG: dihydropteroate synthase [Phascolarctobacterium sp.]|nr:dihydropteroate synthase [Phascolarctobacterium sp.]